MPGPGTPYESCLKAKLKIHPKINRYKTTLLKCTQKQNRQSKFNIISFIDKLPKKASVRDINNSEIKDKVTNVLF